LERTLFGLSIESPSAFRSAIIYRVSSGLLEADLGIAHEYDKTHLYSVRSDSVDISNSTSRTLPSFDGVPMNED